jgi:hypothetical protein
MTLPNSLTGKEYATIIFLFFDTIMKTIFTRYFLALLFFPVKSICYLDFHVNNQKSTLEDNNINLP